MAERNVNALQPSRVRAASAACRQASLVTRIQRSLPSRMWAPTSESPSASFIDSRSPTRSSSSDSGDVGSAGAAGSARSSSGSPQPPAVLRGRALGGLLGVALGLGRLLGRFDLLVGDLLVSDLVLGSHALTVSRRQWVHPSSAQPCPRAGCAPAAARCPRAAPRAGAGSRARRRRPG